VCDHILKRVKQTRQHPALLLGASPRGSLGLFRASQAMAAIQGERSVSMDRVDDLVESVLAHRLIVRPENKGQWNQTNDILRELLAAGK
jgi:MoxR-like ATPase